RRGSRQAPSGLARPVWATCRGQRRWDARAARPGPRPHKPLLWKARPCYRGGGSPARGGGDPGHRGTARVASRAGAAARDGRRAPRLERIDVETAADMEAAMARAAADADIVIMAAAVADFRPKASADSKLSKEDGVPELVLEPTPDILTALAARRPTGQVLVGF